MKKKLITIFLILNLFFVTTNVFAGNFVTGLKSITTSIVLLEAGTTLFVTGLFLANEAKDLIFSNKKKFNLNKDVIEESNKLLDKNLDKKEKEVFWIETNVFSY